MASGEPIHNLIIHFKTGRYTIKNVSSDSYNHLDMLFDVSERALKDVSSQTDNYITLSLPIPGSRQVMELQNDMDVKKMFEMYKKTQNIHVVLRVSQTPPPPPVVAAPPQLEKSVKGKEPTSPEPGWDPYCLGLTKIMAEKTGEAAELEVNRMKQHRKSYVKSKLVNIAYKAEEYKKRIRIDPADEFCAKRLQTLTLCSAALLRRLPPEERVRFEQDLEMEKSAFAVAPPVPLHLLESEEEEEEEDEDEEEEV